MYLTLLLFVYVDERVRNTYSHVWMGIVRWRERAILVRIMTLFLSLFLLLSSLMFVFLRIADLLNYW